MEELYYKGINWKSRNILRKFLKTDTKNPYVANILVSIFKNNPEFIGQAIEQIKSKKNPKTITNLLDKINAAEVESGGSARGFYYIGNYKLKHEWEIKTKVHVGVSIGAIAAVFHALNNSQKEFGISTSPEDFENFAEELRKSSGIVDLYNKEHDFKEKYQKIIKKIGYVTRYALKGSFVDSSGVEEFFRYKFSNLKVRDLDGLFIPVTNFETGKQEIFGGDSQAYIKDILRLTAALPNLYDLPLYNKQIYADGSLNNVFPIDIAFDKGHSDLVFGTCLTNYLAEGHVNFGGVSKDIKLNLRMTDIMQRETIKPRVRYYTGKKPEEVASEGDPRGRLVLIMPDLSKIDFLDFFSKGPELIKKGYMDTKETLEKFFDPDFSHSEYNSKYFLKQLGDRYELARYIIKKGTNLGKSLEENGSELITRLFH